MITIYKYKIIYNFNNNQIDVFLKNEVQMINKN